MVRVIRVGVNIVFLGRDRGRVDFVKGWGSREVGIFFFRIEG